MSDNNLENVFETLVKSDEFDEALTKGSDIKENIDTSMKTRNKTNFDWFYDIMFKSRRDIQEICEKKKKDRTADDNKALKDFKALTKRQYRMVRDMIFIPESEALNDDGTTNNIPKKVVQIVERLSATYAILEYIGNSVMRDLFKKHGITINCNSLEEQSEVFENEYIKKDMISIFDENCNIQKEIEGSNNRIKSEVFVNEVPSELQYDKDSNPAGLKDADFVKLVNMKYKLIKSQKGDKEAQDKASEQVLNEAEKKTFDIVRNSTIRKSLMAMGMDESIEE